MRAVVILLALQERNQWKTTRKLRFCSKRIRWLKGAACGWSRRISFQFGSHTHTFDSCDAYVQMLLRPSCDAFTFLTSWEHAWWLIESSHWMLYTCAIINYSANQNSWRSKGESIMIRYDNDIYQGMQFVQKDTHARTWDRQINWWIYV